MTLDALHIDEIGDSVRARHLAVPIARVTRFDPQDDFAQAQQVLKERQFDHAPVMLGERPVGVIGIEPGEADRVGDAMVPLTAGFLVSGDTCFSDLLSELQNQALLFVLEGRTIVGIVTPGDLGGVGGRTHFYVRLARLEMALSTYLRARFKNQEQALTRLEDKQRHAFANTRKRLIKNDAYIDDVACLTLLDLVTIAERHRPFAALARRHQVDWELLKNGFSSFRNDVMHPARDFALATKQGLSVMEGFDRQLRAALDAAELAMDGG